jgi:type IV pilus assembly protein PilY1
MNHMHESAPVRGRSRRTLTRVAVFLVSWWAGGAAYAVDFPSQPLQTGVSQPAPNVIFILDDSLSMTTQSNQNGDQLDTYLTWCTSGTCPNQPLLPDQPGTDPDNEGPGAPYTKNPLSYNPHTSYLAWATANTTDTTVQRMANASYTGAYSSDQFASGTTFDLSSTAQTYYVRSGSAPTTPPPTDR